MEDSMPGVLRLVRTAFHLRAQIIDVSPLGHVLCCPSCERELSLHQPDESMPSQLIATCHQCSAWFSLIEITHDGDEVLVIELPRRSAAADVSEGLRAAG